MGDMLEPEPLGDEEVTMGHATCEEGDLFGLISDYLAGDLIRALGSLEKHCRDYSDDKFAKDLTVTDALVDKPESSQDFGHNPPEQSKVTQDLIKRFAKKLSEDIGTVNDPTALGHVLSIIGNISYKGTDNWRRLFLRYHTAVKVVDFLERPGLTETVIQNGLSSLIGLCRLKETTDEIFPHERKEDENGKPVHIMKDPEKWTTRMSTILRYLGEGYIPDINGRAAKVIRLFIQYYRPKACALMCDLGGLELLCRAIRLNNDKCIESASYAMCFFFEFTTRTEEQSEQIPECINKKLAVRLAQIIQSDEQFELSPRHYAASCLLHVLRWVPEAKKDCLFAHPKVEELMNLLMTEELMQLYVELED